MNIEDPTEKIPTNELPHHDYTHAEVEHLLGNDENAENREQVMEGAQQERQTMLTNILTSDLVSNGLDLVPFVGGGKMLVESIAGGKLNGEKMTGKERIIHAAMGAGSLALDFTGIGEAKDAVVVTGKGVQLVEKAGGMLAEKGAVKAANVFSKTATFMAEHPEATAVAEKYAENKIRDGVDKVKEYRKAA
jgi:hypothetical protein